MHHTVTNVRVFHDSDVTEWHFNSLFEHTTYSFNDTHCHDLGEYLRSDCDLKFASYHVPFPHSTDWLEKFEQTYPISNHTFIFCSELHQSTVDQLLTLDRPNVTIFICGFFNFKLQHAKVFEWMDWFITTTHFYTEINKTILNERLLPHSNKPKLFDILLGCQRTHRDFIFNYVHENALNNQSIMTYFRRWNLDLRKTDYVFESDDVEFIETPQQTIHQIYYHGYQMPLSQVVPFVIYNQTYYSVVAETNAVNEFNFYTEKIVKPIISKRMFIMIAGQNYLANLKKLGFKTFSDVINESYDLEPDNTRRWQMAMDQVKFLSTQDPVEIYAKIKDVVEHNQRLMLTTNWHQQVGQLLLSEIMPYLTDAHIMHD